MSRRLFNCLTSRVIGHTPSKSKMSTAATGEKWRLANVTSNVDRLVAELLIWRKQPKEVLTSVLKELKGILH